MSGVQQTSLDTYENIVKPNLGERQRQVLRVFLLNRSFTNHELQSMECGRMSLNTVSMILVADNEKKKAFIPFARSSPEPLNRRIGGA